MLYLIILITLTTLLTLPLLSFLKTLIELQSKLEEDTAALPVAEKKLVKLSEQKEKADAELDEAFEALKGKTEPIRIKMEVKQKELVKPLHVSRF